MESTVNPAFDNFNPMLEHQLNPCFEASQKYRMNFQVISSLGLSSFPWIWLLARNHNLVHWTLPNDYKLKHIDPLEQEAHSAMQNSALYEGWLEEIKVRLD